MYARSTTVMGNPQMMDEGIAYVRDTVMPAVTQMEGCVGLSLLCDRESGRCIATTAWADEMAMRASAERVVEMRQRAADMFGGPAEVQEWEVAIMHRRREAHAGACTRVIWATSDPSQADEHMSTFRMALLPKMDDLPGFCSVSLMIDRATGRSATAVTYDSRQSMAEADQQATAMRGEFVRAVGGEITDMAEFDLVLAHLHVPEIV
jgi:hypothetical protein